ncbi:hypothetical protein TVAG_244530 [Trichomonas vaginalis G3]|uniref:DUF3447 domain-containing protein n=1 Tax=Trichomonas vaginalis (strain ATCC PRA-98 / G3) TaxID=412133 RepID=A2ES40_TRIV3|nr:proteasome regulatory particle assembly [Trichomonas vaginalis G3]EAY04552.1 hypothetical protein TVAG_244530 [Trichomonas vaginalis G3]KAI5508500.1 proteasome regulatory particle assembly [Trichomonas vaginalis G3]|eukprot:XP_001316775.1 hypothetical protein [Trichomonas vaginalis G3]
MISEYLHKYADIIDAYEQLFCLSSTDSADRVLDLISSIIITKYKVPVNDIIGSVLLAAQFNYRSIILYFKIIVHLLAKLYDVPNLSIIDENVELFLTKEFGSAEINQIEESFPKEDEIQYIIMYDQIDRFREYVTNHSIDQFSMDAMQYYNLSLVEACCYFGSVNIFYFLISNYEIEINKKCLEMSIIGRNTDIINECMKNNELDRNMLDTVMTSHNNKFLEYLLERDLCKPEDFSFKLIIMSHNLKGVFLLFDKDKDSIIPWCATFPQSIDILRDHIQNLNLTKTDKYDKNILHFACLHNNIEICKLILNSSFADQKFINSFKFPDKTALHYAIKNNNKEMVELLISHGADVNAQNNGSYSPLHYAVTKNCNVLIETLVSHGADINATYGYDNTTALHIAVENNSKEAAQILISLGADLNMKTKFKEFTPLLSAVFENKKEIVEFLIFSRRRYKCYRP